MAKKQKIATKVIKKKWIEILAPSLLNEQVVGEAYTIESKSLIGKILTINLMTITNDIKKQNISVKLKIAKTTPDKAFTEFVGYRIVPSSIRRLVRRGKTRIDYVMVCKPKGGKNIRLKLFIITNSLTHNSVATRIRRTAAYLLKEYISKTSYEVLVKDLITHKIQNHLRENLRKIYPVRICEIRALEIEKEKFHDLETKKSTEGVVEVKEPEKTEKVEKEAPKEEKKQAEKKLEAKEGRKEPKKEEKKEKTVKEASKEEKKEAEEEKKEPENAKLKEPKQEKPEPEPRKKEDKK